PHVPDRGGNRCPRMCSIAALLALVPSLMLRKEGARAMSLSSLVRRTGLAAAALVVAALVFPALAYALSADVVISQVYGGGGNSGSTYKNDFIELHNRGTAAVNLAGWSVQYASAAGVTWSVTALSGSIAAGGYYLVQEAQGTGGTTNLPAHDATGTTAMSATAAKVALVNTTTPLA